MMAALTQKLRTLLRRRETVFGINRRNVELVYAHNRRGDYPKADDKALCKRLLEARGVPIPRTIHMCSNLYDAHTALKVLESHDEFVLKPANSSGGNGIIVIKGRTSDGSWLGSGDKCFTRAALERHIANIVFGAFSGDQADKAIIEERVNFHPILQELSGGGGDLRVLALRGRPFQAMLRLPTNASGGRANLHQGAIGVAVDIETGTTGQAKIAGRTLSTHPDTGCTLTGVQLPHWDEVLETARAAAAAMPLGYLGIDILMAVDRGPLVVEVNARPGLEIQNVNGIGIGGALQETFGVAKS
jgi:alpha-L-glutamate ligase-like protein